MSILRSILPNDGDNAKEMLKNYARLRQSIHAFEQEEEKAIFEFICDFVKAHSHLPLSKTLLEAFEEKIELADRVRDLLNREKASYQGDFLLLVEKEVDKQRVQKLSRALMDVQMIVKHGLEVKEGRVTKKYSGPTDASNYLSGVLPAIRTPTFGGMESSGATEAFDEFIGKLDATRDAKVELLPQTGLVPIDKEITGFMKGKLYLMAGFTGQLKSQTSMNFAYHQAMNQGLNVVFFSLEMPKDQCLSMVYALHSCHPKFKDIRQSLGIQTDPYEVKGLSFKKLQRPKELTPEEVDFLKNYVGPDLKDGLARGRYGQIHIVALEGQLTIEDLTVQAEEIHQKSPLSVVYVDHAGLMHPTQKGLNSTTERLNEIIRNLKRLAMSFNSMEGIPVVSLFQLSREGFKQALKTNGGYDLTSLSYANEAERSADIVLATWYHEEQRARNVVKITNLKNREGALIEDFDAEISWPSGRIVNSLMSAPKSMPAPLEVKGKGGSKGKSKKPKDDDFLDALEGLN
jgi:hypothetical protein